MDSIPGKNTLKRLLEISQCFKIPKNIQNDDFIVSEIYFDYIQGDIQHGRNSGSKETGSPRGPDPAHDDGLQR